MEKYAASCRLILCSNSISRVMPAIRSRCLTIRVPAPSNDQIEQILMVILFGFFFFFFFFFFFN